MMHHCPCNYNGTVKLMEACSTVSMITAVYDDGDDLISKLVGNDARQHVPMPNI